MAGVVNGLMSYFWPGFDKNQTKVLLKSSLIRLKLHKNKTAQIVKNQRLEIQQLVKNGKDELARIRVEHVMRNEELNQAFELIELFVEKLQVRLDLLDMHQHCPEELLEALHTVIYSASLISEITELSQLNQQFALKYGREYVLEIILKGSPFINAAVQHKLAVKQPDPHIVEHYLIGIVGAEEFENLEHVHHHHHHTTEQTPPSGINNTPGVMSPFPPAYTSPSNIQQPTTNSLFQNTHSEPSAPALGSSNLSVDTPVVFPMPPNSTGPASTDKVTESQDKTSLDLDDLTARFEALKKKTHKQ